MFTKVWFEEIENILKSKGLDSDSSTFDEIKSNLKNKKILNSKEFASECIYVILASGFSQKTAKKIHSKIINFLFNSKETNFDILYNYLIGLFNNKNKISAIIKIWLDKDAIVENYYKQTSLESRLLFLLKLPHIGKITVNHLARNLGENIVKYDIWIQRLGVLYSKNTGLNDKINNSKLDKDIKIVCDNMFSFMEKETSLPRGYIDVVLWKACQNGLINFNK